MSLSDNGIGLRTWPVPYTAADAAQDAARRHGMDLPRSIAEAVAAAVLECADDECRVSMEVAPEYWPAAADTARTRLRRSLAIDLADRELLPVTLPREVLSNPPVPWKMVKVELVVPVRRP